jgi:membrane protease YdiL (CAAX protease family)
MKLLDIPSSVNVGMLLLLFFGYVIQAASEEILFRGFLMCDLARRRSPVSAVILSSFAFALAHGSNVEIGAIALLNLFLFGVLASLWVLRTGSLIGAAALHTAWNFTQGHVFGCRVSGLVTNSTIFYSDVLPSHKLTNGGEFGPEGGVAVTVVFIVFIVLLLVFPSRKKNSEAD